MDRNDLIAEGHRTLVSLHERRILFGGNTFRGELDYELYELANMAAWANFKRLDLGKAPIPMSQVSQAQDRAAGDAGYEGELIRSLVALILD